MINKYKKKKLVNRLKNELSSENPDYDQIYEIISDFESYNLNEISKLKEHKTLVLKNITGALKQCINAHGPITKSYIGSAAKRIYGNLKTPDVNEIYKVEVIKLITITIVKISLIVGLIKLLTLII